MYSPIFRSTGLDIDDSFLALLWIDMYFSKKLCLTVSLISTAANSAWNGEFRVKCRQGCTGTVVGWKEGKCGKGCNYKLLMMHVNNFRFGSSWLCFLFRMIRQRPTHVMSQESSECFSPLFCFYYWYYSCNLCVCTCVCVCMYTVLTNLLDHQS